VNSFKLRKKAINLTRCWSKEIEEQKGLMSIWKDIKLVRSRKNENYSNFVLLYSSILGRI
jgi:hypothetical protein